MKPFHIYQFHRLLLFALALVFAVHAHAETDFAAVLERRPG